MRAQSKKYLLVLEAIRAQPGCASLLAQREIPEAELKDAVHRITCSAQPGSALHRAGHEILTRSPRTFGQWLRRNPQLRTVRHAQFVPMALPKNALPTRTAAIAEARRLAQANPNRKYVVLQVVTEVHALPPT